MTLPSKITTTLLLSRPARFDIARLRRVVEARLAPESPVFSDRRWRHEPLLSSEEMYLWVSARDLPLADERMAGALSSGLPEMLHEDHGACIARHRAAITLTIGTGPDPESGGHAPSQQAYDRLLIVAHAAATQVAEACHPLAIHWGQSDQIFSSARFRAMSGMMFPLPLFLHPRPRLHRIDETDWLSLDIVGADQILGCRVRTAPAPVSLSWMLHRVYALASHLRARGQSLDDGTAFATGDGERFTLRTEADGGLVMVLEEKDGVPVPRPEPDMSTCVA